MQLIDRDGHVGRELLGRELGLGEGSIKTLVKHLKMNNLAKTSNRGTTMTERGQAIFAELTSFLPAETPLPSCSVALGRFNHAILVKELSYAVKSGIEQRDAAIRIGGTGATTLLFTDNKFVMPTTAGRTQDSLRKDPATRSALVRSLEPEQGDVIIVGSADIDKRTAEMAAKNAALFTIVDHERHYQTR
ncbi:MAG TPA: DUF4443 domain-containing protein, partial [Nitrososphaera sp.]|nr:DUF4443 domain-containing protein [Nitrososphaera sp.]